MVPHEAARWRWSRHYLRMGSTLACGTAPTGPCWTSWQSSRLPGSGKQCPRNIYCCLCLLSIQPCSCQMEFYWQSQSRILPFFYNFYFDLLTLKKNHCTSLKYFDSGEYFPVHLTAPPHVFQNKIRNKCYMWGGVSQVKMRPLCQSVNLYQELEWNSHEFTNLNIYTCFRSCWQPRRGLNGSYSCDSIKYLVMHYKSCIIRYGSSCLWRIKWLQMFPGLCHTYVMSCAVIQY